MILFRSSVVTFVLFYVVMFRDIARFSVMATGVSCRHFEWCH